MEETKKKCCVQHGGLAETRQTARKQSGHSGKCSLTKFSRSLFNLEVSGVPRAIQKRERIEQERVGGEREEKRERGR